MDMPRRRLVEELAVHLAGWMTGAGTRHGRSGPIPHSFQAPFDSCCHALWRLRVAFPTDQAGSDLGEPGLGEFNGLPSGYFAFLDEAEIRRRITAFYDGGDALFLAAINAFVDCLNWRDAPVGLSRDPQPANGLPESLWRALEQAALAVPDGTDYRWTDSFLQHVWRHHPELSGFEESRSQRRSAGR